MNRKVQGSHSVEELKLLLEQGKLNVEGLGFVQMTSKKVIDETDRITVVAEDDNEFLFDLSTEYGPDDLDRYYWSMSISTHDPATV